jgi:methylase of polypeptide subunit release factors
MADESTQNELSASAVVGRVPIKLVTGRQETSGLNFDLKPGAIVAHENSTVLFVCG